MENGVRRFELPAGGTLDLRPVGPSDDEFLVAVYASTREEELSQVEWPEGQREAFVRWQAEMQRREYELRFPDAEYNVVLVDERPAGRLWIGRDAEQVRLLDIALLPEFQNRGVGTLLLGLLIDEARRTGKALRHMILVTNDGARRFYERLGFEVIEVVNGAYLHMEWRRVAATGADATSRS
jgi:GNAT superfamily N-acetyltransferase